MILDPYAPSSALESLTYTQRNQDVPPPSFARSAVEGPVIHVTDRAKTHLESLLRNHGVPGVRVKLRSRGCSGLSYVMEYVQDPLPTDACIPLNDHQALYVHKPALLFLVGTELDYQDTPTRSGFLFVNPHEKGKCGCGSSFHV